MESEDGAKSSFGKAYVYPGRPEKFERKEKGGKKRHSVVDR